jgi:hypothetical protein
MEKGTVAYLRLIAQEFFLLSTEAIAQSRTWQEEMKKLVQVRKTPATKKFFVRRGKRDVGNKKTARQLRRSFLQGRIVPTEANSVKTLWRNLMSAKRGVSINFYEINIFVFSNLQKRSTWCGIVQFQAEYRPNATNLP